MHEDRLRWNAKYSEATTLSRPSPLVTKYHGMAPGHKVLDLAAGDGRNALYLAERGFTVFAVEISDRAVARLSRFDHDRVIPVQADLDSFPVRSERFDLIVNCRFLDRRLFPALQEGLTPSGLILFESALESKLPHVSQPRNRDYLLRTNELLHAFLGLRIVYYEERLQTDYLHVEKTINLASLTAQKPQGGL